MLEWHSGGLADFRDRPGAIGERAARHAAIGNHPQPARRRAEGVDLIVADWKDTCTATGCNYLNTAGFVRVPVSPTTNATLRPGTYMLDMARGPGRLDTNMTFAKSFALGAGSRLQVRADVFNVLNRTNYYINPQLAINNANFGRITSATPGDTGARVFQLGGRLTF